MFKTVHDVLKDHLITILMSISLISIALKLLASRRGDLVCFMQQSPGLDTKQYAGAAQFIVSSDKCLVKVFERHGGSIMQNIPYILFVLTLILALLEKFCFRIEKIEQKTERFHTIIVKEGLLSSKDPELTEDINDVKASKETVSRGRQRDELCAELKNGSALYYIYIGKNGFTLVFVVFILAYFCSQNLHVQEQAPMADCTNEESIAIKPNQTATCQQRFSRQFHLFQLLHFSVMSVYALLCIGCLVFCFGANGSKHYHELKDCCVKCNGKGELVPKPEGEKCMSTSYFPPNCSPPSNCRQPG